MNPRLTTIAAIAVCTASLSLSALIRGDGWLIAGVGAIATVALAGVATRLPMPRGTVVTGLVVLVAAAPLLAGPSWYGPLAALALVALVCVCTVGGKLPRSLAILATYLGCLLIYLNAVFASGASLAVVIPTHHSMSVLSALPGQAFSAFHFAPPIPEYKGVSLTAAAGIGLVATAVDVLAVRLRRPAIAGLPLLVLFSVPVASNLKAFTIGQGFAFAVGLAGFLMLLSSDGRERLRVWGRLVTFRYLRPGEEEVGRDPDTREIAASGRRIGLTAICLAIVVPLIVPTLGAHDLFGISGDGSGGGAGGAGGLDGILAQVQQKLLAKPAPVLTYTTTAKSPAQQYFQVYVLNYDAARNEWLPSASTLRAVAGSRLPAAVPGLTNAIRAATVQTSVVTKGDASGGAYLPVPYAPVRLSVTGAPTGWLELAGSLMLYGGDEPNNLRYTVTSREADPTAAQLQTQALVPSGIQADYGSYRGPDASKLLKIARKETAGAPTAYAEAVDLQRWFRSSGAFSYTLKPKLPDSRGWLLDFLTKDRRGFCQQFAWAFAVLARLLNIPAQIAVGYTAGTPVSNGRWLVTTADAHAWPELYFPNVGWVRFEPTPGGSAGQGTATVPSYAVSPAAGKSGTNPGAPLPTPSATAPAGRANRAAGNRFARLGQPGRGNATAPPGSGFPFAIVLPVLVVLLAAAPRAVRVLSRRKRWLAASGDAGLAHAAWRETIDDLADFGLARTPSESPRAFVRRIAAEEAMSPAASQALARIGAAEERARYASSAPPGAGLPRDVVAVRRAVAASATRSQRLRAWLLPASTLTAVGRGMQRAGGALNWLDMSLPSAARQLRRAVTSRSA